MIKLLVGLGNPGSQYAGTRHNAGFWWLDRVARQLKVGVAQDKSFQGEVGRTTVDGRPLWLLKPMTFMNLSGRSVAALARFFKIAPDEILVAHDELDLLPGHMKLKKGGGHAGHNGLRDMHEQLSSSDYWRLRIGIGHPGVKSEVADFVLRKPPPDERAQIEDTVERAIAALPALLDGDMSKATLLLHTRPAKPSDPPPEG